MSQALDIDLDIALVGGGIAGLWLLNRLRRAGYRVALFEHRALGSDQTLASQGMIHGGIKYTLSGALSGASEAIAAMPEIWRACLGGEGELDLRRTRVLSDHFYLWSNQGLGGRMSSFFASKLLRGRLESVPKADYPALLAQTAGSLYRLEDLVLDIPSLVTNLTQPLLEDLCLVDSDRCRLSQTADGRVELRIATPQQELRVNARRLILTAGQGNEALLQQLSITQPAMQRRPLQQVMVSHPALPEFYGHCLGANTHPRLTISSHQLADGQPVWYLGGDLAEKGAKQTPDQLITCAQAELSELLPRLNLSGARWATLPVTRAEPQQPGLARPDTAFIRPVQALPQLLVAWPTKLTLVPELARQAFTLLSDADLHPRGGSHGLRQYLSEPPLAPTPWSHAFQSIEAPAHAL